VVYKLAYVKLLECSPISPWLVHGFERRLSYPGVQVLTDLSVVTGHCCFGKSLPRVFAVLV